MKAYLKDAFLEHQSKWSMKRLIPSGDSGEEIIESEKDMIQSKWFEGKCKQDVSWC